MIYPEYCKHWDFFTEFETLFFPLFDSKVILLGGKIGDVLTLRNRYLTGAKMTKEEAISASKVLTPEQKVYMKEKEALKYKREGLTALGTLSSLALQNQKRRKGENGNRKNNLSVRHKDTNTGKGFK